MSDKGDDEIDRESYYQMAADVWERGCRGENLSVKEGERFQHLARSRFYTFAMSAAHAQINSDGQKIQLLIRSLALDLVRSPGLETVWRQSDYAEERFGGLVTAMLNEVRGQ